MTDHVLTRNRLKAIPAITTFEDLLSKSTLDDIDKEIFRMHYLQRKDMGFIADTLGYTKGAIKKRHLKGLEKLMQLF